MTARVKLVGLTSPSASTDCHTAGDLIAYAARVSNPANQNNQGSNFVLMKKSKKFIKFKDFIIKLPNSLGLIQHKQLLNNDSMPFVES